MEVVVRVGGLRRVAVPVLLVAVFASCGARTGALQSTLRAGDFPAAAARALCDNLGPCCTTVGRPFDPATCEAAMEARLSLEFSVREAAADTLVPSRCVDQAAASARQCRTWTPCTEVLELKVAHSKLGDSCSSTCFPARGSLACGGDATGTGSCFASDGLFCSSQLDQCMGAATVGLPCLPDDFSCKGSWCHLGVCTAFLSEGADCTHDVAGCAEGFVCEAGSRFCSSADAFASVTCTCDRLRAEGAECTDDRQCASTPCSGGRCQFEPLVASDLASICTG